MSYNGVYWLDSLDLMTNLSQREKGDQLLIYLSQIFLNEMPARLLTLDRCNSVMLDLSWGKCRDAFPDH